MPSPIPLLLPKIKAKFLGEGTGHDWYHLERVWKLAKHIAVQEAQPYDSIVLEAAALTHDIGDWKFLNANETQEQLIRDFLQPVPGFTPEQIEHICLIAAKISFKGKNVDDEMPSYEGKIVQDADRLDALGAIGIARAFAYGGKIDRPLYDPEISAENHNSAQAYAATQKTGTAINHFYEKLLLLKDRMNTATAKKIAQQRHEYMEQFLEQFMDEWEVRL